MEEAQGKPSLREIFRAIRLQMPELPPWRPDAESNQFGDLAASWIAAHLPSNQIAAVMDIATDIFGDRDTAEEWLREPNLATDNKPPITCLGTEDGFARVKTLLQRIEYGVLA